MSDKKQRRLPIFVEKREKNQDGMDMNRNKVRAGGDLLTSQKSKPAYGCTLPPIGNGRMMSQHTGEQDSNHIPPLPRVARKQVNLLNKRYSAPGPRFDSEHPQQDRHGFETLPKVSAVLLQHRGNKEDSQLKRDRLPVRLPPVDSKPPSGCCSDWLAGPKHQPAVPTKTTEVTNAFKLPDINSTPVIKRSRPKTGRLQPLLPVFGNGEDKILKLPLLTNTKRALSPIVDKTKKNRMM